MDLQLKGRRALVTGGSRGIGRAIARQLALEGADVAILGRDTKRATDTAAELARETGRAIVPVTADTADDQAVGQAIAAAVKGLGGGIDILVNAAANPGGLIPQAGLETLAAETLHGEMNTKVMGYVRCAREVAPHMKQRKWGRIINISGLAARSSGNAVGSIRNVAVSALTKTLADELGPHGINVTVVHPGVTMTENVGKKIRNEAASKGITEAEATRHVAAQNSIQRVIEAADVAYVVAFLASPLSVAINGDAIAAGGGVGKAIHY